MSPDPPEDAVEAGRGGWRYGETVGPERCRSCGWVGTSDDCGCGLDADHEPLFTSEAVLAAAHGAGTIRWESEYQEPVALLRENHEDRVEAMSSEFDYPGSSWESRQKDDSLYARTRAFLARTEEGNAKGATNE